MAQGHRLKSEIEQGNLEKYYLGQQARKMMALKPFQDLLKNATRIRQQRKENEISEEPIVEKDDIDVRELTDMYKQDIPASVQDSTTSNDGHQSRSRFS